MTNNHTTDTLNHDQMLSVIDQMLRACDLFHWADEDGSHNYWIDQPRFNKGQDLNIYQGIGRPFSAEMLKRPQAWVCNIELKTSQTRPPSELSQHALDHACEITALGLPSYQSKFMGQAAYSVGIGVQAGEPISWDQCSIQGASISFIDHGKDSHQLIKYGEAENAGELADLLLNLIPDLRDKRYNLPHPYNRGEALNKILFSDLTHQQVTMMGRLIHSIDEGSGESPLMDNDQWYSVLYPDYVDGVKRSVRFDHVYNTTYRLHKAGWLVRVQTGRGKFILKIGEHLRGIS
jgi:hypothetical protein